MIPVDWPPPVAPHEETADQSAEHQGDQHEQAGHPEGTHDHVSNGQFLGRLLDDGDDEGVGSVLHQLPVYRCRPAPEMVVTFLSEVWYFRRASHRAWAICCR